MEIAQPRDKKATFLKLRNVQDLFLFVPLQLQAMMIIDHNDMMKRQRKETCLIVPLVRLSVPLSPHSWGRRGKHAAGAGNKPWMLRARNIQPGHYMFF